MFLRTINTILFPISCLCCRRAADNSLCTECVRCLPLKTKHTCPVCQKAEASIGSVCTKCFGKTSLEGVFSVLSYKHPTTQRIIRTYKYSFARTLAPRLAKVMTRGLKRSALPLPDLIIPVPLHKRRLRYRGFNQSELLAARLSESVLPGNPIPCSANILIRTRHTPPQARTQSRTARRKNLKHAFAVSCDEDVQGKRIWLVDDVATTGSTLSESARALNKAGAKEVWGVVLAG